MHPVVHSFWSVTARVFIVTLLSLVFFAGVIAILVFIFRRPLRKYKPADLAVFEKVKGFVGPSANRFMLFITFLGKHQFLVPANLVLIFYFLLIGEHNWFSIRVLTIALSSLVLMLLLKNLFRRKRPLSPLLEAAKGLSFPSGHAIMAVTFYGLIIYIISHTLTGWPEGILIALMLCLIILIGFSRIYLRVHYASDVLAGFTIGIFWLLISLNVLNQVEQYFSGV